MKKVLKKMKLVPYVTEDIHDKDILTDKLLLDSSPYLKSIHGLDRSMIRVLNSDFDEEKKYNLYSQMLRNYLLFKNKYTNSEFHKTNNQDQNNNQFNNLMNTASPQPSQPIIPPFNFSNIPTVSTPKASTSVFTTPRTSKKIGTKLKKSIRKQNILAKTKIKNILGNQTTSD